MQSVFSLTVYVTYATWAGWLSFASGNAPSAQPQEKTILLVTKGGGCHPRRRWTVILPTTNISTKTR